MGGLFSKKIPGKWYWKQIVSLITKFDVTLLATWNKTEVEGDPIRTSVIHSSFLYPWIIQIKASVNKNFLTCSYFIFNHQYINLWYVQFPPTLCIIMRLINWTWRICTVFLHSVENLPYSLRQYNILLIFHNYFIIWTIQYW